MTSEINKKTTLPNAGDLVAPATDVVAEQMGDDVKKAKETVNQGREYVSEGFKYINEAKVAKNALPTQNTHSPAPIAATPKKEVPTPEADPTASEPSYVSPPPSTSENIQKSEITGQNNITNIKIAIEGGVNITKYKHFSLSQSAVEHHSFLLVLDYDSLGEAENHQMEHIKNLLGKRITITFFYRGEMKDVPERNFVGVITNVSFSRERNNQGSIVLTGKSPTILLDAAPHTQSFGGKQVIALKSVVEQTIKEGLGSNFSFRVEPAYSNVTYLCQYEETHYNFLARVAETYGEQFFYDGEKLHFGKLPTPEAPIKLMFGKNVDEIDIQIRTQHINRSFYGYNSGDDKALTSKETPIEHKSSLAKDAFEISKNTFKTASLQVAPMKALTGSDIQTAQKSTVGSIATQVFITSGKTSVPFLYPGCVVEMEMYDSINKEANYLTKLMITEIRHTLDSIGNYVGIFEAIAADTGFLPRPVFKTPIAEPQTATVVDNKDSKGRVQVRFDWQQGSTEWIRVMTPDAGGSEKVSKNRGFVAIPEIGDQVMVGFIHNHPDRPYVMGSLFHGKVGGGGGSGNNMKSLSSKSGHTIELNDGGGITIKDKTGNNLITLDGTNKITIGAIDNITLGTGDSSISLSKNGTIRISGKNISISGSSLIEQAAGDSNKIAISSEEGGSIGVSSKDIKLIGGETSSVSAKNTTIEGKAKATVTSSGPTSVQGSILKLN
ncbi:type VI secretion system Vgr family protein [Capnocytophaga sputigena]|jgi:phage-related baseplate assembly protein|uniref:type VI secretion system Vgr family protein n=1 Tax=Capnocytophaga sputigena TaxID=1019 RepID=UPI00248E7939|nr:phage baseplate assembly protein V [Capnocytophaga sputigena]